MKNISGIFILFLMASCFLSCEEDDNFSNSPNLRIEFSSDTIRFDTVFTSFGSSTRRLKVYNRNNNSLTLSSVELASGGESGFRLNVDGMSGNRVTDVDLLKKDSMYVFVEVTIDPLDANIPLLIRDSIRFDYNGITRYVQLEAIGQDVIWWKDGMIISQDTTLTAEKPFLIYGSVVVDTSAVLHIDKNVSLYFHYGAGMNVYGKLAVNGTLEEPVIFRGDRTDNLFTKVPYDRIPGQWEGVIIDSISFNNHFEYFYLRNSVKGIWFEASSLSDKKAVFNNSIIQNTTSHGLYAINCDIDITNSLFANAGGAVVKLIGGKYSFTHCTLANYMSRVTRKDAALIMGNIADDQKTYPEMLGCSFFNSIIAGSFNNRGEIEFQNKINGNEKNISHYFENCLVMSKNTDDKNAKDVIWNVTPEFAYLNDDMNYYYSFELDSASPAINKANIEYSVSLPLDIRGISRLTDEGPDIGCYEWIGSDAE